MSCNVMMYVINEFGCLLSDMFDSHTLMRVYCVVLFI